MGWQVLADEFSWQAWKREGAERVLPPKGLRNTWRWKRLLANPPVAEVEFLLVESAWENFRRREDRFSVPIQLVQAYRQAGIPVIFWNKEDPLHFDRFLPLATACDIVLTTDADSVLRYREAHSQAIVDTMLFAAQPDLHRQYYEKEADKRIFFAGTLRSHHDDRMVGFNQLIRPAVDVGLHIFSRKGSWPEDCQACVVGSHPYLRLLREYSRYSIGLNISSIKDSPTMFPRRVVEMPMANIFVVSDRCRALEELFPEIPQSHSASQTRDILGHFLTHEAERAELLTALKTRIEQHHTCRHRVEQMRAMLAAL